MTITTTAMGMKAPCIERPRCSASRWRSGGWTRSHLIWPEPAVNFDLYRDRSLRFSANRKDFARR
jgi:hypothetical protein